jgi:hypothetical protein
VGDVPVSTLSVRGQLEALLGVIAPPTAPLAIPYRAQIRGLALLDAGLRMSHVTRVAEVLKPQNRTSLSRVIAADLDLTQLAPRTLHLLSIDVDDSFRGGASRPHWIPIARHSRSALANVEVVLSDGERLPRMSHRSTLDLLCAAFVRMFSMIISSSPDAALPTSTVRQALTRYPRSIWMIEAALIRYVNDGSMAGVHFFTGPEPGPEPDPAPAGRRKRPDQDDHPHLIRQRAIALLEALFDDAQDPFFELLRMAATDFLLVAGIPQGRSMAQIRYEAPLIKAAERPHPSWSTWRGLLPAGRDFVIDYETSIPSNAKSFHVSVEEDPGVNIRGFALATTHEAASIGSICQTLTALADAIEDDGGHDEPLPAKVVELELQAAIARLGLILRRRLAELEHYRDYVVRQRGERPAPPLRLDAAGDRLDRAALDGAGAYPALSYLTRLTREHAQGRRTRLAQDEEFTSPGQLRRLSAAVEGLRLDTAVGVDNDAREHGAHAHWTRPGSADAQRVATQVVARVRMVLTDERPSLTDSVRVMVAALVTIVYLMGTFNTGQVLWPIPSGGRIDTTFHRFLQADAVVAVLFVVPSVLLTRLDIPATSEVLGQLRIFARAAAYAAVAITATLALAIATVGVVGLAISFRVAFWSLVGVLLLVQLDVVARTRRNRTPVPWGEPIPPWLTALSPGAPVRVREADAVFRTNSGALSGRVGQPR